MEFNSLTKALGLLEATAGHPEGRSLAELASEVGMPKPTAHRILKTLTALGYLERPASGVYRQSPQVKRLVSDADVRRVATRTSDPFPTTALGRAIVSHLPVDLVKKTASTISSRLKSASPKSQPRPIRPR